MDPRKRQTSTATPAEPGRNSHFALAAPPLHPLEHSDYRYVTTHVKIVCTAEKSWIVGLSNDREQLKPQVVVGAFEKFANRTRHKVRHRHRRCRCAALDLSRDIRMQRRHDAGRDVRSIKLRDQFSKHAALCSWANLRDHPALLGQATEPFIEREVPQFR